MECKFKQNLRDELSYQGITVKELSQRTGIPVRTIENYLGKRNAIPLVDNASLIAKALGVSIDWLVTGENVESTNNSKIKKEFNPMLRDISSMPENIQNAFKTIIHYSVESKK